MAASVALGAIVSQPGTAKRTGGGVSLVCIKPTGMILLRRPRRGYRLGTHNLDGPTTQAIEDVSLEWATPVLWIRP